MRGGLLQNGGEGGNLFLKVHEFVARALCAREMDSGVRLLDLATAQHGPPADTIEFVRQHVSNRGMREQTRLQIARRPAPCGRHLHTDINQLAVRSIGCMSCPKAAASWRA